MGRIRSLKPEILEDERTAGLSMPAFRLFIGSILIADDHGGLRANAAQLAGAVYWATDLENKEAIAEAALAELAEAGLLVIYQVRGQRYAAIRNWAKHQRVDRPGRPRVPQPDDADAVDITETIKSSRIDRESIANDSRATRVSHATDLRSSEHRNIGSSEHRIVEHGNEQPDGGTEPAPRDPPAKTPAALTKTKARDLIQSPIVERVIEHYMSYHPRAKPDEKERALIRKRLKEGRTEDDLKRAIDGCHVSPWHCGDNPGGNKYQSLELIVRDAKHVTTFLEKLDDHQRGVDRPRPNTAADRRIDDTLSLTIAAREIEREEERAQFWSDDEDTEGQLRLPERGASYTRFETRGHT